MIKTLNKIFIVLFSLFSIGTLSLNAEEITPVVTSNAYPSNVPILEENYYYNINSSVIFLQDFPLFNSAGGDIYYDNLYYLYRANNRNNGNAFGEIMNVIEIYNSTNSLTYYQGNTMFRIFLGKELDDGTLQTTYSSTISLYSFVYLFVGNNRYGNIVMNGLSNDFFSGTLKFNNLCFYLTEQSASNYTLSFGVNRGSYDNTNMVTFANIPFNEGQYDFIGIEQFFFSTDIINNLADRRGTDVLHWFNYTANNNFLHFRAFSNYQSRNTFYNVNGYNDGYSAGYMEGQASADILSPVITSVVAGVYDLLVPIGNVTILGFNIWIILGIMATISLIFITLKLFRKGS